ncbi:hypothetical protein MtrunA17_Chr4g0010041 [Medicago truncatula]|uniref:Uncharacterized protein n=1 Tax=Medicago truncatula TaxID=3880 RepID=A0A396I0J4_MEDTR|nr:uncharacterized protein At3g17950 isoform X1 [Medicago truncatula]RHN59140.1 hypothetical protein MtrunA17_Chr4g0010041 [Medicago truncatula]
MAQQEEGWPLGLGLLNARVGLVRNSEFSGSISFSRISTILSSSSIHSTDSSSYLDTESTGSLFHNKSITLGNLIGISSSFLELSRSSRGREMVPSNENKKNHKLKPWLFSLCTKLTTDAVNPNHIRVPSLGQYLEAERRARSTYRRNQRAFILGHNVCSPVQESNSLFAGSQVSLSSPASLGEDTGRDTNRSLKQNNGNGTPISFSSLCG